MTEDWEGDSEKAFGRGGAAGDGRDDGSTPGEGCPVTPLGARDGYYWLFSPSGAERKVWYKQLFKRDGLDDLFEGHTGWLFDNFAKDERGLDVAKAGRYLVRACVAEGLFDDDVQRRGAGIWRDADKLIVHCGDRVLVEGQWRTAGFRHGGFLYPRRPAIARPAALAATVADGERLLAAAGLWNFEDPAGPGLVVGFIGDSLLGAAPDWRAHMFVRAPSGSGKTWEAEFVANACGARPPANNITPAAIYQGLTGEARALVIDEAEKSERDDRITEVLKIIRLMSGRDGGNIGRGSAGGKAQRYTVAGSAFLTAILHPDLAPQDRSRFAVLRLRPLATGPGAIGGAEKALAAIALAAELAPALQARAIAGWPRFLATVAIYRTAALRDGVEPRSADTMAALLAGRDLLLRDDLPGASEAEGDIDAIDHLLVRESDRAADGEGEQCLLHLLSSSVETWGGGERKTVGEKIAEARAVGAQRTEINRILGRCGLKLVFVTADGQRTLQTLLVARRHVGLQRIFKDTRWDHAVWRQALEDLPGAGSWGPERFAGALSRSSAVPIDLLPPAEGDWDPGPHGPPVPTPEDLGVE